MRASFKFVRDNSLSIALFALFAVCVGGAIWAGFLWQNETLAAHHQPAIGLWSYLGSGTFLEGLSTIGRRRSCNWRRSLSFRVFSISAVLPIRASPSITGSIAV